MLMDVLKTSQERHKIKNIIKKQEVSNTFLRHSLKALFNSFCFVLFCCLLGYISKPTVPFTYIIYYKKQTFQVNKHWDFIFLSLSLVLRESQKEKRKKRPIFPFWIQQNGNELISILLKSSRLATNRLPVISVFP